MVKAAAPAAVPRNLRRLDSVDIGPPGEPRAHSDTARHGRYHNRNPGEGPGGTTERRSGDGPNGDRRQRLGTKVVPGDLNGGLGALAADHKARGAQAHGAVVVARGGPIDAEFHMTAHGESLAATETDSGGTHVGDGAGSPARRRSLTGQAEVNRQGQGKP